MDHLQLLACLLFIYLCKLLPEKLSKILSPKIWQITKKSPRKETKSLFRYNFLLVDLKVRLLQLLIHLPGQWLEVIISFTQNFYVRTSQNPGKQTPL